MLQIIYIVMIIDPAASMMLFVTVSATHMQQTLSCCLYAVKPGNESQGLPGGGTSKSWI